MPRFACHLLAAALSWGALAAHPAHAQNRVANYATGKAGTASYEHFSFWVMGNQRTDIQYAYGKDRKDSRPRYLAPARLHGQPGFRVQFESGRTLYLLPSGSTLKVSASRTAAPKTFAWEYEGPVNGVGTVCSVCATSATDAGRMLRRYYLK